MLNRRHLRVKVLQVLYAFFQSDSNDLEEGEKELLFNIEKAYDLYLHQLLLFSELAYVADKYIEKKKSVGITFKKDTLLEKKFYENDLIKTILDSKALSVKCKDRKISWSENYDLIRKLFLQIRKTEPYKNYINSKNKSLKEDKKFFLKIFYKCICEFEMLHHFYEEKSIYWIDDWELVVKATAKTIDLISENDQELPLASLYKDDEDKKFACQLFGKTVLNYKEFDSMIENKTKNWDIDRIAIMDIILMKMALTELIKFPEIPIKVTLNEYIEISKMYSSQKSKVFINGVLDKLVEELEKDNKIKKEGKGLINKTYS